VSMMRGAFLDKKWDVTPGGNSYWGWEGSRFTVHGSPFWFAVR